ncbi:3-dehydroquinate dehydratase [bioreactor metagenome]|uniref:3-dehydroquinate dehydratase n=1 Tax=bioreactor metagenome TaxID=1076179 RepID=A0A645EVB6_9ZZZZ|nr:type II 3-dehydroquinate dehydratase [Candidatus Pelethousia sp.]
MRKYLMLNGPNMNLMGMREPYYGTVTLAEVEEKIKFLAQEYGVEVDFYQSNHEGNLVDKLQEVRGKVDGIIFNPAAFTYTSYAIRDAITACNHRVIEVHVSNIHAREEFRHHSLLAAIVAGQIIGLGAKGYEMALRYLVETDREKKNT